MGCSGSKEKDTTAKKEWDELVAKNQVAKLLDDEWKSPSKGKGNALLTTSEAVTKASVDEVESFFKKYVDFEASEKEGNVEHFQFENGTGNAIEAQANEAQDFYFEEIAAAEEAAAEEEKKEEAEGEAKEGEEGEEKKEEEEKKVELKVLTPLEFMEQGVWAHKPASMKLNEKSVGRTFGGGWKRRYLNVPAGEEKLNYAEAKGKASKGTIGFDEIVSVEELTAEEAKQLKAPAKVANFAFVVKTSTLKYNFGCETEEDLKRTVEAIKTFVKGEAGETGPEQGLLTVATSIKPKEGATIKYYHQVQYEIKEEEPEAPAAEAEGETAAAPAEGEAAAEEEKKEEAAEEEKKEEAAEEEKKEEEAAEEKKEEEAAASE